MRILIIRHGDPDYEHDTLTEKGHREAKLLAEKLKNEKIDYIYSSPLGRAKDTCAYTAKALGMEDKVVVKEWLREFNFRVTMPCGDNRSVAWDMFPHEWIDDPKAYDKDRWLDQDFYRAVDMEKRYRNVTDSLDELLASHGYRREGNIYKTDCGHTETVAFFCHFGLEMVLLSRLCGISPIPLWHHFAALPTSVTTLYTEERIEGEAVFRCCGFGDTGHLYAGQEPTSTAARFCETFHSKDRH